jgi:ABC-type polar amino acid transport system ATPase subunit
MARFIKVEHLHKRFGDHVVIEDLSLEVAKGEIVVFQGPSGIGKSTFLRCLTFLDSFDKGVITIGSVSAQAGMNDVSDRDTILALRRQVGYVFQFFHLFPHLTILNNLTLGPIKVIGEAPEKARETALSLLKRVGLEQKANQYPAALSGGQQQRAAIARTLAMHPEGVLFDEPTSSLDPAMKAEMVSVMQEFIQDGLTMLIVTHEPHVVDRIASRVVTFGEKCQIS